MIGRNMFIRMIGIIPTQPNGIEQNGAANIMVRMPIRRISTSMRENSSSENSVRCFAHRRLSLPRHYHPLQPRLRIIAGRAHQKGAAFLFEISRAESIATNHIVNAVTRVILS